MNSQRALGLVIQMRNVGGSVLLTKLKTFGSIMKAHDHSLLSHGDFYSFSNKFYIFDLLSVLGDRQEYK